ncbi:factor C subunit 1 [Seminavis robusta]|uniref:Replication factor C subunit 1 n=1 Tax=Seminavis robusta TaxID=568900 RepID=A0A9N8HNJ9_9STRA|nr:factor C subunit 1 [Seminavis robusta]|eukprot:Sro827_g207800.1 factor C subunit 1 (1127) ;mRNA; r:13838-17650
MPVDIRNFFAAKGKASTSKKKSTEKDKKRSSSSSADAAASSKKSTSAKARKKILSPIAEEGPSSKAGKKKKKQSRTWDDDSDTDATTDGPANDEEPPKKQKAKTNDDNDSTSNDDEEPAKKKASSYFQKNKPADNKPKNLKEVSADDFFASSSKKRRTSPRRTARSQPKGSYVVDVDEDEEDEKPKSSHKRKKAPGDEDDGFVDNNDDDDDDLEDVEEEDQKKPSKRPSPKAAKNPPTKPVRKPSPFKKPKVQSDDSDKGDDDDEEDVKPKATPSSIGKNKRTAVKEEETPSSSKKRKTTPRSSAKKKSPPPKKEKIVLLEPSLECEQFDEDKAVPECLEGLTFVFTGILDPLSRDDAADYVKMLGGKVTSAVSGKTSFLVVGDVLEDGRPYHEGKKYQQAKEKGTKIVMGVKFLYGLAKLYSDKAKANLPQEEQQVEDEEKPAASAQPAAAKKPAMANPYAKKPVANPYAKKLNPYAKSNNNPNAKKTDNPYAKSASAPTKQEDGPTKKRGSDTNDLWVDRYAPTSTHDILGNRDCVTKLTTWLARWEGRFNNDKAVGKAFSNPQGPWKVALLSGPPGIGKTTTATLVGKEAGRDVLEFNASDVRSKKSMQTSLGDITGSRCVEGYFQSNSKGTGKGKTGSSNKKRLIIMDEVDGMGGGDRGGLAELIQMIKNSRVPIICICNDRQSQKMKSLLPYCFDLRFKRPIKSQIAKAAIKIAQMEGMMVQPNAAEQMAESCGNDIRQVINAIQMWSSDNRGNNSNALTYKGLKEREKTIQKDDILRVSLFDASRLILEGRKGLAKADPEAERASFFKRNDAFFVDYGFTGLIVQQNYLKVMGPQFLAVKRSNNADQAADFLERVHSAAQSMSDYNLVENKVRGGSDMNWGLLPFSGVCAVKTGFHAAGPTGAMYPGFPEFTSWLGKNSSQGKKSRILQELNHHMNYRISGGTQEVRLSYLPFMRQRFLTQLKESDDEDRNTVAIKLMDEYGLDRDDVFENLDEFNMNSKGPKIGDLDSKSKAAFTREYNQGSHKSQALVVEQGAPKKKKRKAGSAGDTADPDAIDDDAKAEESEDDDDEEDMEKLKEAFAKKKRRSAGGAKGGAAKGKGGAAKGKGGAAKGKGRGRGKK